MSYERRTELRVDLDMEIRIDKVILGETIKNLDKPIIMQLKNLSCAGAYLCCKLNLPPVVKLFINLSFKDYDFCILSEIIRKEENNDEFYYGIKFLQLTELEKQKMRKYIFEQQIKNKRKNK